MGSLGAKGKALEVLHKGNSTHQRICVCIKGYHRKQEICEENTNCSPGFGVQYPVQQDKNTECIPCKNGYFSNVSSSTEQCQPWKNCTKLRLEVKHPGTNKSDVVCGHLFTNSLSQVVIPIMVLIILSVVAVFIVLVVYCRKKYSPLKVGVQDWLQETCEKLCGSEKKSPYGEADMIEPKCDYKKIEAFPAEERIHAYPNNAKEMEVPRGRMIPTEDEYMDQRRSTFSEPENGGLESDLESASLGTMPADEDTGSDRLLFPKEDSRSTPPHLENQRGRSGKETFRKWQEEHYTTDPIENNFGQNRHEFHLHPQASYSFPEKNTDDDSYSFFTNTDYMRSNSSRSADSISTSEIPSSPSGNVTGNNNTTVISSAPVMNIKTDVVVVYYREDFQKAQAPSENKENMKRPMQEERHDHCDSFVANTQPYSYTDSSCCSNPTEDFTENVSSDPSSPARTSPLTSESGSFNNVVYPPIQEEGKPTYYYSEMV
ncbi:tumor necrosis factor receptor superfamily member 11A [Gastrophryne carolinensis]